MPAEIQRLQLLWKVSQACS